MNTPITLLYVHNALNTLPAILRSLPPHSEETPLLVVHDGCLDSSKSDSGDCTGDPGPLLRGLAAEGKLDLVAMDASPNRAKALNAGFAHAAARWPHRDVLRLHADTLPEMTENSATESFVHLLARALKNVSGCGVLGVRLVSPDGLILEQGRRLVCGLGLHAPDRHLLRLTPDTPLPVDSPAHQVDAVSGACALYTSAFLDAVRRVNHGQVLDEGFGPKGLEEDDLCFTARALGYEVRVLPGLRAVHLGLIPPPEGADAPELTRRLQRERRLSEAQAELWAHKWGWDPLLPDLGEVRRLYGHTPVCWQVGETLRYTETTPDSLPAVDLCMVSWNGARVLPRCLESLAATEYPADRLTFYIIDNASTDDTPELLRRFAESAPWPVRMERLAVNAGAVVGLNWAFSLGRAPLVAKLDDDIVVPPDWLQKLASAFQARPYAGVVGPCVVDDSPVALVQCADFSYHPTPFAHELEDATTQWPGLARVTHVRGCCNLYRRDVFARCGLLDIGYSPSQWDDPDHHTALLHEGYEVIYDGSVRVAHKCGLGQRPTVRSLTTGAMHKATMLAKWGTESPELLECALLLSREGRFVPAAWQTGADAPCATVPHVAHTTPMPQAPDAVLLAHMTRRCRAILEDEGGLSPVLPGLARQLRAAAAKSLAEGNPAKALGELRTAASCGAGDAYFGHTLHALADLLATLGAQNPDLRRRADLFGMSEPTMGIAAPAFAQSTSTPSPTSTPSLRIAFCVPHALRQDADLHALLDTYADTLRVHGHTVSLHAGPYVPNHDVHIAHFWTFTHPHETLRHARLLGQARPNLPLLLTPLLHDSSLDALVPGLSKAARQGFTPESVLPNPPANEGDAPLLRRKVLELLHGVLPCSPAEYALLGLPEFTGQTLPLPATTPATTPAAFCDAGGPMGSVLCVAPFHPAANQAALLAALTTVMASHPALPIVLVGAALEPWYLHACRRQNPKALFVDELSPDLLASALASARLVVLPSVEPCWKAGPRIAVAARLAGCPLVVANGTVAAALPHVHTCNPASVPDMTRALREALNAPPPPSISALDPAALLLQTYTSLRDRLAHRFEDHARC